MQKIKKYIFEFVTIITICCMYLKHIPTWYSNWSDPDSFYAFGVFIFVFIGYFIKENINNFRAIKKEFSYAGAPFLILSSFIYILGIRADYDFITSFSLPLLIASIILTLYGSKLLKATLFPIVLFASTLPIFPLHRITMPLQLLSADITTYILNFLNIHAFNEGTTIYVEKHLISIIPGCSGLKSLYSLFFISIIYSYFMNTKTFKKILFILFSLPLAFIMNVSRILFVSFYVLYNGTEKAHEFHDGAGLVAYIISFGIIYSVSNLLNDKDDGSNYET